MSMTRSGVVFAGLIALGSGCVSDGGGAGAGDTGGDSATQDSGVPDSGGPDSGVPDSGVPDNGVPDSGLQDAEVPGCSLIDSPPVVVNHDGQVVENLRINADPGPAILVGGFASVVIRNVAIEHVNGPGVAISNADDIRVEHVTVAYLGAPVSGANPSADHHNIVISFSARPIVRHVRLSQGSSGVHLLESDDSVLQEIEGHDFRGPFPRGQLVQWDKSDNGLLEDFSVVQPPGSWPEDNVNIYQSLGVTVRRGVIDGNNSPSGVGVIFDGDNATGLVEDVDALRMGNGCFSNYAGAEGNVFRRTRCRDNICTDQGRGLPSSNALMWCGKTGLSQLRIEQSSYFAACNPDNIVWPRDSFELVEVVEQDFTPRAPLELEFCWE